MKELTFDQVEDVKGGWVPLAVYGVKAGLKIYKGYRLAKTANERGQAENSEP